MPVSCALLNNYIIIVPILEYSDGVDDKFHLTYLMVEGSDRNNHYNELWQIGHVGKHVMWSLSGTTMMNLVQGALNVPHHYRHVSL